MYRSKVWLILLISPSCVGASLIMCQPTKRPPSKIA